MTDSALLSFYRGTGPDHAGRMINDILAWDHRSLEMVHDYIQWLFPLPDPSRFNTAAPLLTPDDIAAFRTEPHLQAKARQALDVLLCFLGLVRRHGKIERTDDHSLHWLQPLNHNYLRLTRILLFLGHVGLPHEAKMLLKCLEEIARDKGGDAIAASTLTYWRNAAEKASL